jgi:hypothetical protein
MEWSLQACSRSLLQFLQENDSISRHKIKSNSVIDPPFPRGKVNILGGHSIGHSKQKSVYVHVSHSERFPR